MHKISVSRRTFTKAALASLGAAAVGVAAGGSIPTVALAADEKAASAGPEVKRIRTSCRG